MTTPAIPAATLILFRKRAGAPDEHLLIQRGAAMAFAANAVVFPGGRIDAADHALAATLGGDDPDLLAAKIAAVRETIEETGIACAIEPEPSVATIADWRAALAAGEPLSALLGEHRLVPERLLPFARWMPPPRLERRVYDTRFFIAEAPAASAPLADGGESVHAFWADAATALAEADAGRHHIIFPTRRNLERLAALGTFAAAAAQAARHPVRTITPQVEERDGREWLCIPPDADAGYPVTAELLETARRG